MLRNIVVRLVAALVVVWAAFLAAGASAAEPLLLDGPTPVDALAGHFDYLLDPDWRLTAEDFARPAGVEMAPMPGAVPDFGYTASRIWLRLPIVNGTDGINAWEFVVHANFTQQIAIYRMGADGSLATLLDLTEDSPFSARPADDPLMVAPFTLAPGEAADLLVAYYSQGASRITMTVETGDSFAAMAGLSQAKNYAFYGMMAVLIVLALVGLTVLRQPVFAAYAAYLTSVFLYVAHADGTAFQYIWPNWPRFNSMASIPLGSAVMVFGALFAMSFLRTARYHRIMHRVLLGLVVGVLLLDIVLWALDPQLLKRLLVLMISVSVLLFLTAGINAARTRFREVRFYLFGWTAGLIPAILFTARLAFGAELSFITPYDTIRLALAVDAMMMGLAIFDRYSQLRQQALNETLAQTERQLALSRRLALLEESVEQVEAGAREREESVKDIVHDLRQPMHALRLSLREALEADSKTGDVGQIESALGYMERLVAERLAETETVGSPPAPSNSRGPEPH